MTNESVERETLEILAEKITRYANEADEKTLEAAMLIREARKLVEAGEAGDVTWETWAREKLKLGDSRLRELQRIAKAKDPQKELERQREMTQKRVERHRKKKKSAALRNGGASVTETAELEADRQSLIAWAESAPIDHVTETLTYIRQYDAAETVSNSAQSAEPSAA